MLMMIEVFWNVLVCCLVNSYWHFGRALCLQLQGQSVQEKYSCSQTIWNRSEKEPPEKIFLSYPIWMEMEVEPTSET